MKREQQCHLGFLLFLLGPLFMCGISMTAHADDLGDNEDLPSREAKWEFGLDGAMTYPLGHKSMSANVPNAPALVSDMGEEWPEAGFSPDPAGFSIVSADARSSGEFGAHLLYEAMPFLSLGVEGGYGVERVGTLTNRGIYQSRTSQVTFMVDYSRLTYHVGPVIKVGGWIGRFRPYVMAGASGYTINQRITANYLDTVDDGPFPSPLHSLLNRTDIYAGASAGGGLEYRIWGGTIAADIRFHRIFTPGENTYYAAPGLRFAYDF